MSYKQQVKPDTKKIGQLIKEKHWSVDRLAVAINITKKDIRKWEKLNKQYKKYKR
jgi:DNA-binding transcriptional regulator YiaG